MDSESLQGIPFLGSLPIDPRIAEACDAGKALIHHDPSSPTADLLARTVRPLLELDGERSWKETGAFLQNEDAPIKYMTV